MWESPSGAARMVAGPRTSTRQPAGAMNVLPATVVCGVSAASTSPAGCPGAVPEAAGDWRTTRVNARSAAKFSMGAPYRISGQGVDWAAARTLDSAGGAFRPPVRHARALVPAEPYA